MIKTEKVKVKLKCCKCVPKQQVVQFHSDVIEYHYKFVKKSIIKRLTNKLLYVMKN